MTHASILAFILGSAAAGGVFLAFSSFVMEALARLPANDGIRAMQSINVAVVNPLFMTVLFGTCLVGVAATVLVWSNVGARWWIAAAAMIYMIGVILVTMLFNVPLNDALRDAASVPDADRLWRGYVGSWTGWNHVRTLSGLMASALATLAWKMASE